MKLSVKGQTLLFRLRHVTPLLSIGIGAGLLILGLIASTEGIIPSVFSEESRVVIVNLSDSVNTNDSI